MADEFWKKGDAAAALGPDGLMVAAKGAKCPCASTCKMTGCAGCCDHQSQGTFWSKVAGKACCGTGACTEGCN